MNRLSMVHPAWLLQLTIVCAFALQSSVPSETLTGTQFFVYPHDFLDDTQRTMPWGFTFKIYAMFEDYNLEWAPPDLSDAPLTINRLEPGFNEQPIVLRLLHFWMQNCFELEPDRRMIHSLWIDKNEDLIEGYTHVCLAGQIPDFFSRGCIYMMKSVMTKRPRRALRTSPTPLRLKIGGEDQLKQLPKNPNLPWFPKTAFYPTSFTAVKNRLHSKTEFTDVVGRLLSVSEEETGPYRMPTISAVLEDCDGNTIMVKHASLDHALSQASIIAAERNGPILLAFTSMMVVNLEDSENLCLINTVGTRIIHGCYSRRFSLLRTTFSHAHRPVATGHSPALRPVFVQYSLPPKTTLLGLMSMKMPLCTPHNPCVWCLITIKRILTYKNLTHYHPETTQYPRFQMNVECKDITASSCVLLFTNDASSSLLQKSAREYASLDDDSANTCLDSAVGKVFTAEIRATLQTDLAEPVFEVITLWDPLAFAIESNCSCESVL